MLSISVASPLTYAPPPIATLSPDASLRESLIVLDVIVRYAALTAPPNVSGPPLLALAIGDDAARELEVAGRIEAAGEAVRVIAVRDGQIADRERAEADLEIAVRQHAVVVAVDGQDRGAGTDDRQIVDVVIAEHAEIDRALRQRDRAASRARKDRSCRLRRRRRSRCAACRRCRRRRSS